MDPLVLWLVLGALIAGALWLAWRANEIFCVSVRDGRVLVVRGRVPGGLLGELREMVANPPVRRATIRAVKGEHAAGISTWGLDEGRQQRLRNIFALYPMSRLRAPVASKEQRTFGQILGIAWIAWLLDRTRRG